MDALLQLAQLFFVQPALAVLHLRARRSLVTLESLVQIRQIQLQQEGQLALAQARAARESAEIDARVNAQLGALGISPGPRASSGVAAPAASPLRGFGDLLAALLVYRGDPPAGPRLAQAAESVLLQRIAPAEARRLATEEGHPLARPAALAQVAASLFGAAPAQDAWPAAALALPRARIGAVLAAVGASSVAVEPGEQDPMRPVYFPVHGAFTLESPWPWIGQDVDAGGLVVSRLQHTGARFTGGTVLGDLQSLFGVTTEGPATLNATVLSGGPYDPVSLNRALDAWLSQLPLGLVPSRGAPSAREIELAGVRAVALEYRFTRMLIASYERRYLVPVPGGPLGIVLWWESPAAEAPRWSAEIDAAAHSLHLGPKPPSRMRPATDATTGVPGVDRALRGAWLYDIGQGDLVEARAAADRALAEQPTSRRARFASAVVSAVSGDLAGALSRLEELWPTVDAGQARLVACFGLRTETWHHGLRPDGSAPGGVPLRPETPPWAARFEDLIGSSPMDLPETFLVRVGVTAAGRTAADAATEAQMEKAGLSTPALLAGLREAAAVARRANLTQPFFYLATVADRIQASTGDAGGALAQLATLAGDAEQTGDHTMCAWCHVTRADLLLASRCPEIAKSTGALVPFLTALPSDEDRAACAEARAEHAAAVESYRKAGAHRGALLAACRLAALDAACGRLEQALAAAAEAGREAEARKDRSLARDAAAIALWATAERGAPDGALRRAADRLAAQARTDGALGWALSWAGVFRGRGAARRDARGEVEPLLSTSIVASALYEAAGAEVQSADVTATRIQALAAIDARAEAAAEVERALSAMERRLSRSPDAGALWGHVTRLALVAQDVYQGLGDGAAARRVAGRLRALTDVLPAVDEAELLDVLALDPAEAILQGKGPAQMAAMARLPLFAARETCLFNGRAALFYAEFLTATQAVEDGRREDAAAPLRAARAAAADLGTQADLFLAMCAALERDRAGTVAAVTRYVEAGCPVEPRGVAALLERLGASLGRGSSSGDEHMARGLSLVVPLLDVVDAWPEAADLLARLDALPSARESAGIDSPAMLATRARVAAGRGDAPAAEDLFARGAAAFEAHRAAQRSERLRRAVASQRVFNDVHASWALFSAAQGRWDAAFEQADRVRARSLVEGVSAGQGTSAEEPRLAELRATVERLQTELLHARQHAPEQVEPIEEALLAASRELEEIAPVAPAAAAPAQVSLADVAAHLPEGTLLLAYLFHWDSLLAWAVTAKGIVRTRRVTEIAGVRFEARPFGARLRGATQRLSDVRPTPAERQALSGELSELASLLIEPFAAEIQAASRVIFVPHAELSTFPFGALPLGARALGLQKPLAFVYSASLLSRGAEASTPAGSPPAPARVLVVGNPTGMEVARRADGTKMPLASLPGAEDEARRVAALYGATPLIGAAATRDEVVRRLQASPPPAVVHLATHGVFDPEVPLGSCIALAGGKVLSADAWAGLRTGAEVVILSACSTASGQLQGGEVMGLTRMILLAGARAVIVSLWPVHDGLTRLLMTALHEALHAGSSAEEAVRKASAHLVASGGDASGAARGAEGAMDGVREARRKGAGPGALDPAWPACWAPFVVVRASP